jgi:hypothetical protein
MHQHGFWLFVEGEEYFLGFEDFPWFRKAPVGCLFNVEFSHSHHIYWPELDVDLDAERKRKSTVTKNKFDLRRVISHKASQLITSETRTVPLFSQYYG